MGTEQNVPSIAQASSNMDTGQERRLRFLEDWAAERRYRRRVGEGAWAGTGGNEGAKGDTSAGEVAEASRNTHASAVTGAAEPPQSYADYVVSLTFATGKGGERRGADEAAAMEAVEGVVQRLGQAGLQVEVRAGLRARRHAGVTELEETPGHVLVFVRCGSERVEHEWRRGRLQDWLGEVDAEAQADAGRAGAVSAAALSSAERQRAVQRLVAGTGEGGAGVVEGRVGACDVVVVGLHDAGFNGRWLRHWAAAWLIDARGLGRLRAHFGEEVALYFGFLQSYLVWLVLPAVAGAAWWAAGAAFSWVFGGLVAVWSIAFTETWARREADLATVWGVHGVQRARTARRREFRALTWTRDAATGERVGQFPAARRWMRRAIGAAAMAGLSLGMAAVVAAIFALQMAVGEFYAGPAARVVALVPVVLLAAVLPAYTALCTRAASVLTAYENYEFEAEHAAQLTAKIFVLRFLQDQLYLFLAAWLFVPHRDAFEVALRRLCGSNALRPLCGAALHPRATPAAVLVRDMLASFVVTSQAVGAASETALPLLLRWWHARGLRRVSRDTPESADVDGWLASGVTRAPPHVQRQFVGRVSLEVALPEYSTYEDYAEMVSQFARVTSFSVAWPLAPLAALVNNWLELRTDAAKICGAMRRPAPCRAESIGPWLDALRFTCWLAAVSNALLVYQFHPAAADALDAATLQRLGRTNLTLALVVLLFAEHVFLAVRFVVVRILASWPGVFERITARSRAQARRRCLDHSAAALRALDTVSSADLPSGAWHAELDHARQLVADAFKSS
ncbi:hypothetical protein H4S08_003574 [Coemansia sp. RSA 1365]|nr:hypothetical protein H4S08_003574 [Coemansia sp. RSA 1365]